MKHFKPNAWMLPQPVLIIGTFNTDGTPNAMNAAWGGQWDHGEIMISMGAHATTQNLNRCGEFTVAFATVDTMVASDYVGITSARNDHDKMSPIFDCSPMTLECRIKEKLYESATGYYIIAEIVDIVCKEEYLAEDGKPDVEKMHLITFDPIHSGYIALGNRTGNAFSDGKLLKRE